LLAGTEVFHVSEEKVGLLVTALAVGIALGSVMAGTISGSHIETGLVPFGGALMGVFSMALGLTSSYTMAVVWLVGVGFAGGLFVVPLNAVLQERAGSAEKGRILATNNFANMVGVICASGALWLLHDLLHWNAGTIIAALGAVTLAGSVGAAWIEPAVTMRFALRIRVEGAEN
jgi:acyl-[acyl-carrier-protein]-phospholipid O-acyltransferase/long-chain-fatty-acid--[acyl-carrier-protein] ligase